MQQCTNTPLFSFRFFLVLILVLLGFSMVLISEIDATKAQGKSGWKYGAATAGIVCGDKLCSEKDQHTIEQKTKVTNVLSPLDQLKNGTPANQVICKEGLILVIKNSNGNPACIKIDSMKTIFSRGWASPLMIN